MTFRYTWTELNTVTLLCLTSMTSLRSLLVTLQPHQHPPLCHTHLHLRTTKFIVPPLPFPTSFSSSLRPRPPPAPLPYSERPHHSLPEISRRLTFVVVLDSTSNAPVPLFMSYLRPLCPPQKTHPSRTRPAPPRCLMAHGLLSSHI